MKNKLLIFGILVVTLLGLLGKGDGLAGPPLMPSSYYGTVKANGSNVPFTTTVSAWIDGVKYAETSVIVFNADTVYNLDVPSDILSTAEIEEGKPGDLITFSINNDFANQTGVWQSGTNTELNLSAFSPDGSFKRYLPIIIN